MGIKNDAERSILVLWMLIVLISTFIGDSVILLATCKYKVLNLHKVLVAIIQHMAFCDLLQSVFRTFPVATATVADKWILGEYLCHIQNNFTMIAPRSSLLFTCALTMVKLLHLKYPLLARTWSKRRGHIMCATLWGFVFGAYASFLVVNISYLRDKLFFSYATYECYYNHRQSSQIPSWFILHSAIGSAIFATLCFTILTVTSILILLLANIFRSRIGGGVRLEGTITVLVTVAIQFLSYLPMTVVYVTLMTVGVELSGRIWRVVTFIVYIKW